MDTRNIDSVENTFVDSLKKLKESGVINGFKYLYSTDRMSDAMSYPFVVFFVSHMEPQHFGNVGLARSYLARAHWFFEVWEQDNETLIGDKIKIKSPHQRMRVVLSEILRADLSLRFENWTYRPEPNSRLGPNDYSSQVTTFDHPERKDLLHMFSISTNVVEDLNLELPDIKIPGDSVEVRTEIERRDV